MTVIALIALGSNLGHRPAHLSAARSAIAMIHGVRLLAVSPVEETAPLGEAAQGPYLNQMVAIRTSQTPRTLLDSLQRIERALGRVRRTRWGARTIDLDIVRFGSVRSRRPDLQLPHPGLASRDFWRREVAVLDLLLGHVA